MQERAFSVMVYHLHINFILITGFVQGGSEQNTHWDQPFSQPYFDNSTRWEVTTTVGLTAHLHCRVRNLGDRAVRILLIFQPNKFLLKLLTFIYYDKYKSQIEIEK